MSKKDFFKNVLKFAPLILAATPYGALAAPLATGIQIGESMTTATGPQKLEAAKDIFLQSVEAHNVIQGHTAIDPVKAKKAADAIISAVVDVANIVTATEEANGDQ